MKIVNKAAPFVIIAIFLIGGIFFYSKWDESVSRNQWDLDKGKDIQAALEENKEDTLDKMREDFSKKQKQIMEQNISDEEKQKQVWILQQELNTKIMEFTDRVNTAADKKIQQLQIADQKRHAADMQIDDRIFTTDIILQDIEKPQISFQENQNEVMVNREKVGKFEEIITLQDFYKSNKSSVETMVDSELAHVYPFMKLPGSYTKVPIE